MLNAHRLALLSELARSGSVNAVGDALAYSPSTVSQQLKVLEREVGATLVERVGRGLALTAEGRLLAQHADEILARMEHARAAVSRVNEIVSGTFRVATFQTAALAILPRALDLMAAQHPELRVVVSHIDPAEALPSLQAREHDLVLGEEYPGRPVVRHGGVSLVPLLDDPLVLVTPAGSGGAEVRDVVARGPWVLEPKGNDARAWAVAACRDLGVEPEVRYESPDLLVQMRLVETGHAIAVLPGLLLRRERPNIDRLRLPGDPSRLVFTAHRIASEGSRALDAVRAAFTRAVEY